MSCICLWFIRNIPCFLIQRVKFLFKSRSVRSNRLSISLSEPPNSGGGSFISMHFFALLLKSVSMISYFFSGVAALLVCTFFSALKKCQCDFIFFSSCTLGTNNLFINFTIVCFVSQMLQGFLFWKIFVYILKNRQKWIWKRLVCILNCYFPRNQSVCNISRIVQTNVPKKQYKYYFRKKARSPWQPTFMHLLLKTIVVALWPIL